MKRRVICIFTLIFWMIALSTFLSIRIEKWMTPVISTVEAEEAGKDAAGNSTYTIPADALIYDDMGMHLYRTREGSGWERGRRVYEVDMSQYWVEGDSLKMDYSGTYIRYATRTLRVGEEVRLPESVFLTEDDNWIAVFPEGIPEYELKDDKMSVETKTETSMIVCAPEAAAPFMEDRARSTVIVEKEDFEWYEPHTSNFYSLGDLESFMKNLLLLGVLAAAMIFIVILWAWSFILSRDYMKHKKLLIINGSVGAGLLALSPLLLHFINLPASLLPQYHITDFPHYGRIFSELFNELNRLAVAGSEIAASAIQHAELSAVVFFVILAFGAVLGIAAIIAEVALEKKSADDVKNYSTTKYSSFWRCYLKRGNLFSSKR